MIERRRITVQGIVQGIGFRPFVYGLALKRSLTGFVRNESGGAVIELQGLLKDIHELEHELKTNMPPSGRIDTVETESRASINNEQIFVIKESISATHTSLSLVPDRDVCPDCLQEMRDPSDRRQGYPFINCTRCGPRYTIVTNLPYDRPNTTMARFDMCPDCLREYEDPLDRRYHAQPIACPVCGPRCWLALPGNLDAGEETGKAVSEAARRLNEGEVVAIKGIGGFHLAADATNEAAVSRLRDYKKRPRKPLAVMVRDLDTARDMVYLDLDAENLLRSPAAPIMVAPRRLTCQVSKSVAPGLTDIGVMLPYSPLHHLLFDEGPAALIMTSGNHPSEPITTTNDDALNHLRADAYLLHDRDIHVANDDSVIRVSRTQPVFLRRSRGYVPETMNASQLPERSALALGAELKVTVSTLHRGELVVGRHLGNLDNPRAESAFRGEVNRMLQFGKIEPEAVAVDLHPDLATTLFAEETFADLPVIRIQHHHAHLAAVMVEHGLGPDVRAAGIILDGFGFGPDGAIWGGEILRGGFRDFERVGHLRYVPQPGGDRAALEPHRMATSLLVDAGLDEIDAPGYNEQIAAICSIRSVSPPTSSAGRLFDGVAALLNVAPEVQDYEGEAAARLEATADPECDDAYPFAVSGNELDTRTLIGALMEDRSETPIRAARFHNGLADGLVAMALVANEERIVLGGGCMVNRLLLRRLITRLKEEKIEILWSQFLPPGDGGLSAGQAACAVCILDSGDKKCV
ncbi:MAG: carbamoyltransferase HypF [Deltaproteobacteria bacterium]|nr:carbamoyltransferase HypF [Deltaproteobacteria bacterium]